ncbi:hypothetical protein DHEL01_v204287 [Diaporthe helianthi]|uniref:Uncharacterized protein n=1 Tax=Diaporthe helianthi TaxID=158607 RepID=A0A2P5I4B1_DIAHE|nr:hypothetical protein DHEL01_v204287 [Diaporthe helianthi]
MYEMQLLECNFLNRHLVAVFILCAFQIANGLAMPTSTNTSSTTTSPKWPSILEWARLVVSLWLNETTAIIAAGVIIGLAAASFAVFGFDWGDYDQAPSDRLIIEEDPNFQGSAEHGNV